MKLFSNFLLVAFLAIATLGQAKDIFQAIQDNDSRFVAEWLQGNPDLKIRDQQGRSVLMQAAISQNHMLVEMFLKAGVDKYAVDNDGKTAQELAIDTEVAIEKAEAQRAVQIFVGTVAAVVLLSGVLLYYMPEESSVKLLQPNVQKFPSGYCHFPPRWYQQRVYVKVSDLLK